ncbi:diacylglycerol kinase kappa-like [Mastacembelus armatus]|uniref:diacylglycerol kinase kappa-like n=1 Tax=Mastacembelus armatus TaxID=205130 RepID=UPI000E463AB9|nr:diacylglycerol kinase kappa-like [Mastacembelus armatus]
MTKEVCLAREVLWSRLGLEVAPFTDHERARCRAPYWCGLLQVEIIYNFIHFYCNAKSFERLIMGNKVSRKQDAPANSDETEQKTGEESGIAQTQENVEIVCLHAEVGESITEVPCLPSEECTLELKDGAKRVTQNYAEPEPVQPEVLTSVSKPPTNSEPASEAKPVPEPGQEPEVTSNLESETEEISEPSSEQVLDSVEALEQQTDMLIQQSLLEPVFSLPVLGNKGFPDVTPKPVNTPPSPAPIPTPVNAGEPSETPVTKTCQDSAKAAEISKTEPEKPTP